MGELLTNAEFAVLPSQRDAWLAQITLLRQVLQGMGGQLLLEFSIPRMGRSIDAVLVAGPVVFVIEFKVGASDFEQSAVEQVWDYALDLKYFHEPSESIAILPIVVATAAANVGPFELRADSDGVFRPICIGSSALRHAIDHALQQVCGGPIDAVRWGSGSYRPTPTIIEAARSLYAQHSVEAIARFDAGAANLRLTSSRIDEIVDEAVGRREKIICFVTGVPGAGKTLVGLNVATRHRRELEQATHAVYLSGNAPLIAVLREALTRDEVVRRKARSEKVRKGQVAESVKAFIQNVHHFRDDALADTNAPFEHVVIFDEAQRAWNRHETASFMQRKKKREGFVYSEPEFLMSYLDRHRDWAVIVCLVGGGQEINRGEAGIEGWLEAIETRFPHWRVFISSRLTDSEYAAGNALERVRTRPGVCTDDTLHLAVSMRSFRAEYVSAFVKALLDTDVAAAQHNLAKVAQRYPIVITRSLDAAKSWVRAKARGSERFGLLLQR
ncbi:MAG: DNA/RNA helicase domain-containing protein [Pirellulales bacterium]